MDPDHDWKFFVGQFRGSEDVEIEAILVHSLVERVEVAKSLALDAARPPLSDISHALPVLQGLRSPPAQFAQRRSGIGNALENSDSGCVRRRIGNLTTFNAEWFCGAHGQRTRYDCNCRGHDSARKSCGSLERMHGLPSDEKIDC